MCLDFILQNHCYCSCQNCKPDTLLLLQKGGNSKNPFAYCVQKSCILLIDSKHAYKRAPFSLKDTTTTTSSTKRGISREIEWSKRRDSNFLPPHFTWERLQPPHQKLKYFEAIISVLLLRTAREFPQKLHSGQLEQEPKPPEWGWVRFWININECIHYFSPSTAGSHSQALVMAVFICRILKCLCNSRVVTQGRSCHQE